MIQVLVHSQRFVIKNLYSHWPSYINQWYFSRVLKNLYWPLSVTSIRNWKIINLMEIFKKCIIVTLALHREVKVLKLTNANWFLTIVKTFFLPLMVLSNFSRLALRFRLLNWLKIKVVGFKFVVNWFQRGLKWI